MNTGRSTLSIESVGTDDMVVVDPFKVIAFSTGIYILTDIFTRRPDTMVYSPFSIGVAEVSTEKEILDPRKLSGGYELLVG